MQALAAGVSRAGVAQNFVASQEHDNLVVQNYYRQYLGRTAGASEVAGWINAMAHGATGPQVIANFIGSQEYFQAHNANTGDWLSSVYQSVLSRAPDQSGYDSWLSVLGKK